MKPWVLLHPSEEGGFWAEVTGFPGCASEGEHVPDIVGEHKVGGGSVD